MAAENDVIVLERGKKILEVATTALFY